jgi:1,4-dihydroxy-2-naphthoyl-CoA synthase
MAALPCHKETHGHPEVQGRALRGDGPGFKEVALYYQTDEAKEAGQAFRQKRKPKFR